MFGGGRVAEERGKVVREHIGARVGRVFVRTSALVPGAEVALWIIRWTVIGRGCLDFALPRSLGAMRGHEDPIAGQRVATAMGMRGRIEDRSRHDLFVYQLDGSFVTGKSDRCA